MNTITILGATGSIGSQAQNVIKANPQHFQVQALTARNSAAKLAQTALALNAKFVALKNPAGADTLATLLKNSGTKWSTGNDAILEAANLPATHTLAATVGTAGLAPTMIAAENGNTIALANKETLVIAGTWLTKTAEKSGARILPVDSEHNALFQLLDNIHPDRIDKLILTASGGPFLHHSADELNRVTPDDARKHPTWSMGNKNSIDSATFFNKGLEIIEAHHLFNTPENKIDVVVHPQSLVHAMVACKDGALLAHLAPPDMQLPIAHALLWPDNPPAAKTISPQDLSRLDFIAPDPDRFPALEISRAALRAGQNAPAVLSLANEAAVAAFLAESLPFTEIPAVVSHALAHTERAPSPSSIAEVETLESEVKALVASRIAGFAK
ncbi:MAG: 1-deoxy-D-xylulose-5-phosphate reductoisomerase [Alphaproteobacteria bacterium]|nr:1-deoxy-D-xylulose-5-phosphate reductoisomerase [Alphaproteobacteria bacterium]MDA8005611.1 1-deoxy-D-xylulose-5-phosphate reductoisomerase [Alphaproteobacteria bacterium]MDA8012761.1 1-deoxy-D-xylulose-5-phosphate reductoisomerase [Alphaproteobacteria bacterium]